jgi:hypothetical protein
MKCMGKNARNARSTKRSVTKEIKQDRQKAGRERKANNNDDLIQCPTKDTVVSGIYLIISVLFFSWQVLPQQLSRPERQLL